MKDQQLRIRIDPDLYSAFKQACLDIDRPASQVLRELIRSFLESQDVARQRTLDLDQGDSRLARKASKGRDAS